MNRRQYIKAAGAAVTGSALAGCIASDPSATADPDDAIGDGAGTETTSDGDRSNGSKTGTLATSVTDQPVDIGDFESCVITIDGLWVKPNEEEADDGSEEDPEESSKAPATPEGDGVTSEAGEATGEIENAKEPNPEETEETEGNEEAEESDGAEETDPAEEGEETEGTEEREGGEGRRYVEFDEPQEADLVRLQGANTQLIDETELAVGSYRYLQLDVSGVEGVLLGAARPKSTHPATLVTVQGAIRDPTERANGLRRGLRTRPARPGKPLSLASGRQGHAGALR